MKEFHGVCSELCVADEDMTFHGIAEAGLTVYPGVTVHLHGILQGPVRVEKHAILCLFGLLEGEIEDRSGRILVRGLFNSSASAVDLWTNQATMA